MTLFITKSLPVSEFCQVTVTVKSGQLILNQSNSIMTGVGSRNCDLKFLEHVINILYLKKNLGVETNPKLVEHLSKSLEMD